MSTFKPYRNTKSDMTFDMADGIARKSKKDLEEFFHECYVKLFHYGKVDEAFYFEMLRDYVKDGGELDPKNAARALGL